MMALPVGIAYHSWHIALKMRHVLAWLAPLHHPRSPDARSPRFRAVVRQGVGHAEIPLVHTLGIIVAGSQDVALGFFECRCPHSSSDKEAFCSAEQLKPRDIRREREKTVSSPAWRSILLKHASLGIFSK